MLTGSLIAHMVLLLLAPLAVGLWLRARLALSWTLFLGGALAFVLGWMLTIFVPPQLGLLISSIAQMGILYLIYRYLLSTVNTEREAVMVGAGQGGIELIIFAIFLAFPTYTQMQSLRNATDQELTRLVARREGTSEEEVQPSQIDELRESVDEYWSTPWYQPLLQAIPSLSALPVQMALAVVVLGAWMSQSLRSLGRAMVLHFLSRSLPIYASILGGVIPGLLLSLLIGGIAVWYLSRLWPVVQEQNARALKDRRKAQKRAKRNR